MLTKLVKRAGLTTLRSMGMFNRLADSPGRQNRLLILCYHGISLDDEHEWEGNLYVTADHFQRRMALLHDFRANVLPLDEAIDRLAKGTLPARSVAITFDDGFYDFHKHAVPAMAKYNFPATLYLTTHYCYNRYPIFNLALDYLIWKAKRETVQCAACGIDQPMPARTAADRRAIKDFLMKRCASLGLASDAKEEMLQELARSVGADYQAFLGSRKLQLMTPDEVTQTARAGIDIQLHTHRHRTPRDRDLFLREIRDNAARIRELTGGNPVHFCYPSGDYDRVFLPWLQEAGVVSGTTCELGLSRRESEPLLLPRLLDDSFVEQVDFESYLCGLRG